MNYLIDLAATLQKLDPIKLDALLDFVRACQGTLWLAGNGGSASTAQHWACDLSKAAGQRVQALGSNPAVLTAWANDRNYEEGLAQEFYTLARVGDALICLSCSGVSPNIAMVIEQAQIMRIPSFLLTGGHRNGEANVVIRVPHTHYGIIEDCHLAIGHWLTEELRG